MSKKIESLTQEQVDSLPMYRDRWLAIGLSNEPLDFERAKEAATRAYKEAGLTPPERWYHFRSPMECAIEMAKIEFGDNPTKDEINKHINAQVYGAHDAGWLSFYEFFLDAGIKECAKLKPLMDLAEVCGWWAPYDDCCALQDRPIAIKFDDQRRLHCQDGPAIEYADGFTVYSWHGVRIPGEWITNPESLTAEKALQLENAELRRSAIEILGWDTIISLLNGRVIDEDEDPLIGTLLEVQHESIGREKFLRVQCGTGRTFAIPVPPEMKTAIQANAWTYGMAANDYNIEVRT